MTMSKMMIPMIKHIRILTIISLVFTDCMIGTYFMSFHHICLFVGDLLAKFLFKLTSACVIRSCVVGDSMKKACWVSTGKCLLSDSVCTATEPLG
jgi:hypothetical protein